MTVHVEMSRPFLAWLDANHDPIRDGLQRAHDHALESRRRCIVVETKAPPSEPDLPTADEALERMRYAWVAPGDVVCDHYKVDSFIAPGGGFCSQVWLGHDERTGERVVVKARERTDTFRRFHCTEVEIHNAVRDCEHVARVIAHDDDRCTIVKEFVDGPNAAQVMRRKGRHVAATVPAASLMSSRLAVSSSAIHAACVAQVEAGLALWRAGWASEHPCEPPNLVFGEVPKVVDVCTGVRLAESEWPRFDPWLRLRFALSARFLALSCLGLPAEGGGVMASEPRPDGLRSDRERLARALPKLATWISAIELQAARDLGAIRH